MTDGSAARKNGAVVVEPPEPQPGSAPGPPLRISDAERERVVDVLKTGCEEGRLTLDEFSERVAATYAARTEADLGVVVADLPAATADRMPASTTGAVPARRATRWTVGIMSGAKHRGRYRLQGKTNAVAFWGGCELDLRYAEVEGPEVEINAVAIMGGIDIVVPEGIAVELTGFAIFGGRNVRVKDVPVLPGSPVIRVRTLAVMGGVTVKSKPSRPTPAVPARSLPVEAAPLSGNVVDAAAAGDDEALKDLRMAAATDGTVTIAFTDIEGFSSITERLGSRRAADLLSEHNDLIRGEVATSGGYEVKSQGDGFMLAFNGATRALRCAVGIQRGFARYNGSHAEVPVRVRIGMHTGEAIRSADDFLGGAVILAARITREASGGEILVSSVLKELCDLSGEFDFGDGREVALKGLSDKRRVYPVVWDGRP
jgi:class 3 adenylate cyclase